MDTAAQNLPMPRLTMRRMLESDVGDVVVTERSAYAFPWSEGIFRDCLRAGYICRVAELDHLFVGYGILSVGPARRTCSTFACTRIFVFGVSGDT